MVEILAVQQQMMAQRSEVMVDVDVNAYADVDDDVILVVNMVLRVLQVIQYGLKIDYLIHVVDGQLDLIFIRN